jgi:manganese oxidase
MDPQHSQDTETSNTNNRETSNTNNTSSALSPSKARRTKRGFTRRHLFNRTAVATGTIAFLSSGAAVLAAASSAQETQAIANNPLSVAAPSSGKLREYWIQADSFFHNLMPTGIDAMSNTTYMAHQSSYWAIGYRAYTSNWETLLPGDDKIGPNTGIPGPTLRAEVGDTLRVHFRNNDTHYKFAHSMHPHGLLYTPANDGTWIAKFGDQAGTALMVGDTFTYEWKAIASSVGSWPYHDHSKPAFVAGSTGSSDNEMNASSGIMELGAELGLFGMIAVTDAQTPQVDREFILCFHDLYETDVPQLSQDFDCFNGYAFLGNTPTFEANVGERVRWRIMVLGTDFHVFHLHGHRWLFNGRYDDSLVFGPATTLTFDYVEDNPGTWLYHCHVTEHMMGGMIGFYVSK